MSLKLQRDLIYFRKYLHPERVEETKYRPDSPLGHASPSPLLQDHLPRLKFPRQRTKLSSKT